MNVVFISRNEPTQLTLPLRVVISVSQLAATFTAASLSSTDYHLPIKMKEELSGRHFDSEDDIIAVALSADPSP